MSAFARIRVIYTGGWLWRLFVIGVILGCISSCARRDVGQLLDHPAVSLIKADSEVSLSEPAWSLDERLLAAEGIPFGMVLVGTPDCGGVYILDLQTEELYPLLDPDCQAKSAWTADPEIISFVDSDLPGVGIHTITLNDKRRRFFTEGNRAAWSPDGKSVAIVRRSQNPTIPLVVDPAGGL
jgi:hypothetical protein